MRSDMLATAFSRVLIVCGMPRSGTTLVGALVATVPGVDVVTEPPSLATFPSLEALREEYLRWVFQTAQDPIENWRAIDQGTAGRRMGAVVEVFCRALKPVVARGPYGEITGTILCLKQPNGELDRELLDRCFPTSTPEYLYCLRSPRDVYASILSAPWGKQTPAEYFLERFALSLSSARQLLETEPDRLHVFDVEQLSADEEFRSDVLGRIFAALRLTASSETQAFIRAWPPTNRTSEAWGGGGSSHKEYLEFSLCEFDRQYAQRHDLQDTLNWLRSCDQSSAVLSALRRPSSLPRIDYCQPRDSAAVTRAEMAVALGRHLYGYRHIPPPLRESVFVDVPASHWAAQWIQQLYLDRYASGLGDRRFLPDALLTREQVAVFLLRSKHGPEYLPPLPQQPFPFVDVGRTHWAAPWICQLVAEGIWHKDDENYYPNQPIGREELTRLLIRTFGTL